MMTTTIGTSSRAISNRLRAIASIAMQLDKIRRERLHIIERIRPLGMPCNLHALPPRKVLINLFSEPLDLFAQRGKVGCEIDRLGKLPHFLVLLFEVFERLF